MKVTLKNYRQSPRKVRLVVDVVRGKGVNEALAALKFIDKRAALPIAKLIESGVANVKQAGKSTEKLFIEKITVDKAATLKRFRPRARGSAARINRRNSHISLELGEK